MAKDIYFKTQRDDYQGFRGIVCIHIPDFQCHTEVTGLEDGVGDLNITAFLAFHGSLDMCNQMQPAEVITFFWLQESRINDTGHNLKVFTQVNKYFLRAESHNSLKEKWAPSLIPTPKGLFLNFDVIKFSHLAFNFTHEILEVGSHDLPD